MLSEKMHMGTLLMLCDHLCSKFPEGFSLGLTQDMGQETDEDEVAEQEEQIAQPGEDEEQDGEGEQAVEDEFLEAHDDTPKINHRCQPNKVLDFLLRSISGHPKKEERIERLTNDGFGGVLQMKRMQSFPNFFLHWCLNSFEGKGSFFKLGGDRILPMTKHDVHRVYDLPMGPKKIVFKDNPKDTSFLRDNALVTNFKALGTLGEDCFVNIDTSFVR